MTEFRLTPLDLWEEEVDGDALLDGIVTAVNQYLVLPEGAREVMALWAVHAHAVNCFNVSPRLHIRAPEKRCGKTRALQVLERLVPKAVRTENVSAAVIARLMDDQQPTLLIDEVDTFLKDKEKGELRGALNGGHLRGGQYLRCEGEKSKQVRGYACFGPVAMAGINRIPATLEDRSVVLVLRRKKGGEPITRFRAHAAKELDDLGRMAARWVQDNEIGLTNHEPRMPRGIEDRAADNWEPLLTIADLAGGDWPDRARQIALKLTKVQAEDDDSINTMLFSDLRGIFEGHEKLASTMICQCLHDIEGRPWNDWGRPPKPINPNQLARLLKPFLISPSKLRTGTETHQGYRREQFIDAWDRYLPPDPLSEPEHQNKPQKTAAESVPVSDPVPEHDSKPEHRDPQKTAECSVVPLQRGVNGSFDTFAPEDGDGDEIEREAIRSEDEFDLAAELPPFLNRQA